MHLNQLQLTTKPTLVSIQNAPSVEEVFASNIPNTLFGLNVRQLLFDQDVGAVLDLRKRIFSALPDPDLVLPEDDEELWAHDHLGPTGFTIGMFSQQNLVAYASLLLPTPNHPEHLGFYMDQSEDDRSRVAHIASCMVLPAFRGLGIQRRTIALRLGVATAMGRSICLALTSVGNYSSRHNLMKSGLSVIWMGETAVRRRRVILARDFSNPLNISSLKAIKAVSALDYERQAELTSCGFIGYAEAIVSSKIGVIYGQPT